MKKVGIVGWRGMVGSVLLERMRSEKDFEGFATTFFSTSQAGQEAPLVTNGNPNLLDATNIEDLANMDIIVSTQGSDYTQGIHTKLRKNNWQGYWIDAASLLRYTSDSALILDPVNRSVIDDAIAEGKKDFIGANCTVSTMLMGVAGLFKQDLVEWMTSMTYQAASGAGAKNVQEMLVQMEDIGSLGVALGSDSAKTILDIDKAVGARLLDDNFPHERFGAALAGNVLPWIDSEVESGQSREEWKGMVETNKILGTTTEIPIDGTCVRVSSMRSHSQALTIKLKSPVPIEEIEKIVAGSTEWTEVVPNNKADSIAKLTPVSVSGHLHVRVGRLRKMTIGDDYLNAFVVGDQLLWGAAEPLRRMLQILI